MTASALEALERDGFLSQPSGLSQIQLSEAVARTDALNLRSAGTRNLLDHGWCRVLAHALRDRLVSDGLLHRSVAAVLCIFFEKTPTRNWKVGLHQDLSIPVDRRVGDLRLGAWSEKEGQLFVQAPDELLRQMLAVRLHLDDCAMDNGPLRVLPGSHHRGRLNASGVADCAVTFDRVDCVANAGELLLMRPLLLHASSKSKRPDTRRRVLHFLFGPDEPRYGLHWSKVA